MQKCPVYGTCALKAELHTLRESERLSYERRYCDSVEGSLLCRARLEQEKNSAPPLREEKELNPRIRIL